MITKSIKQTNKCYKDLIEYFIDYLEKQSIIDSFNINNMSYIPSEYSIQNRDLIVINKNNKFYQYEINPQLQLNEFIGDFISKLNKIESLPILQDKILQDALINTKESFVDDIYKQEMEDKIYDIEQILNNVLEKISLPARSNKNGFYEIDKLKAINNLLEEKNSPYQIINLTPHCIIYGKKAIKDIKDKDNIVVVSSHADIVSNITKVSSEYQDNYYHGTYDNLGTNASIVSLMLLNNLPDNVYFSFTDEEETGKCLGATDTSYYFDNNQINPLYITLDVTDEGYDENSLISIEGLSATNDIKEKIKDLFLEVEGDNKSFNVVKCHKKDISPFDNKYITCDYTVFDESIHYGRVLHKNVVSLCVPTSGNMHSNSGLDIKRPVFLGYILSLNIFLQQYTKSLSRKLDIIKELKDYLVDEAKLIKKTIKYNNSYIPQSSYFSNPNLSYDYGYNSSIDEEDDIYEYEDDEEYDEGNELDFYNDDVIEYLTELAFNYDIDEFEYFYEDVLNEVDTTSLTYDEGYYKEQLLKIFDNVQQIKEIKDEDIDML